MSARLKALVSLSWGLQGSKLFKMSFEQELDGANHQYVFFLSSTVIFGDVLV